MELFVLLLIFILAFVIYSVLKKSKQENSSKESSPITVRISVEHGEYNYEPDTPAVKPDEVWVSEGQEVTIAGYEISDGLIYVGQGLRSVDSYYSVEPALIDPKLKVNRANPDFSGNSMSYWPAYSRITPEARAAYLEWLATGRKEPHACIGYVFLFFYGLERRLLIDTKSSEKARSETTRIISEVERLLELYGQNGSFKGYASNFLDVARLKFARQTIRLSHTGFSQWGEYPLSLKLALAQLSMKGQPIPFKYALSWAEHHPETYLRTPAKRCREEFESLFQIRYQEKFGDGIIVKPNKSPLKVDYKPATNSFYSHTHITLDKIPDLTRLSKPVIQIREIIESCTDELDAYSRYIGRKPEEISRLTAIALLPKELIINQKDDKINQFSNWLKYTLNDADSYVVDSAELLKFWKIENAKNLSKAESVSVAQLMGKLGFGIEPDVRFEGDKIDPNGKVVIFRLRGSVQNTASKAYLAATTILHLAAAVSGADGVVSKEEKLHLERHLESALELSSSERERLSAHLKFLLSSSIGFTGIKKRLADLNNKARKSIAHFLLTIANADGVIDPTEIQILKKIYGLLELDPETIYSDIHNLQANNSTEPVTIQEGPSSQMSDYAIPQLVSSEMESKKADVHLDMSIVEQKLIDTAKVQAILGDIFSGEEVEELSQDGDQISTNADEDVIAGLDKYHSKLLLHLLLKPQWSRLDFEKLCNKFGLMPDGAIETINDSAFELYDDQLIEENNGIEINREVAREIMS